MALPIPYGTVCPWPQQLRRNQPRKKHRNRVRVNVHSFVDGHVLRLCSEADARLMCAEDSEGNPIEGCKPIARRLSRKKSKLTDIQLIARERNERTSPCTITMREAERNAFAQAGFALGAENRISTFEASIDKIDSWPNVHDENNVVVCAGKVHGVLTIPREQLAQL